MEKRFGNRILLYKCYLKLASDVIALEAELFYFAFVVLHPLEWKGADLSDCCIATLYVLMLSGL